MLENLDAVNVKTSKSVRRFRIHISDVFLIYWIQFKESHIIECYADGSSALLHDPNDFETDVHIGKGFVKNNKP